MTEPCPKGHTDYETCFAPFRYCPVEGCRRAGTPPACQKDRQLIDDETGEEFYTLACIRKAGHDGLHRDPLSNTEWAAGE